MATYTLDAQLPNGAYAEDHGLSAEQVRNAYANAPRLGIRILSVTRDDDAPMTEADMIRAFGGA